MAGTGTERASGDCSGHDIVTVSEIPGKGRGLVSAGMIPKGAMILKEPVIVIDDPEEIGLLERSTDRLPYTQPPLM